MELINVYGKEVVTISTRLKDENIMTLACELPLFLLKRLKEQSESYPRTADGYFYVPHKEISTELQYSMYEVRKAIELLEIVGALKTKHIFKNKYMYITEQATNFLQERNYYEG